MDGESSLDLNLGLQQDCVSTIADMTETCLEPYDCEPPTEREVITIIHKSNKTLEKMACICLSLQISLSGLFGLFDSGSHFSNAPQCFSQKACRDYVQWCERINCHATGVHRKYGLRRWERK